MGPTLPLQRRGQTADPSGAILWPGLGLAWLSQELVCVRGSGAGEEEETSPSPGTMKEKGWMAKACRGPVSTLAAGPRRENAPLKAAREGKQGCRRAGPFFLGSGWLQSSPGRAHCDGA